MSALMVNLCCFFFVTAQSISRHYGSTGTVHHRRRRAGNFFPSETPPETISEDGKPFHQVKGMYIMLCALLPTAIEVVIARLSTRRETGGDIMLHQKPLPLRLGPLMRQGYLATSYLNTFDR